MFINDVQIKVRYQETDQMGVVYHANYYVWFEVGRTELLKSIGFPYKKLEEENITLPVIESYCQYIKPACYDDAIVIRSRILEMKGARIKIEYVAIREVDGEILAKGHTVHAFVNKSGKVLKLKKENPGLYEKLVEIV